MSRQSRKAERLLKEQSTVGMRRAERKEQEALAGATKSEAALTKAQRMLAFKEKEGDIQIRPRRVARVGKPLKR